MKAGVWAGLLLLAGLALVACGDEEAAEPIAVAEESRSATFLSLMEHLPDLGENVELDYADYAFARERFGIPLPPPGAPVSEIRAYRDAMLLEAGVSAAGFLGGFGGSLNTDERRDEMGFGVDAVDQEASLVYGASRLSVVRGRVGRHEVEAALRANPSLSGRLEEHRRHGFTYFDWPEFERNFPPDSFPLHDGGRLAVDEGFVLLALRDDGMEAMLDAAAGKRDALTDSEAMQALALAIEELDVHRLLVSTRDYSLDDEQIRELVTGAYGAESIERLERDEGLLEPYMAVGVGRGYDGRDHTAVLVYVYNSPGQAAINADILRRKLAGGVSLAFRKPWSEMVTDARVDVSGSTVRASLHAGPLFGINALNNLDGLILTRSRPAVR